MRVLVVGAGGRLARQVSAALCTPRNKVFALDRAALDVRDTPRLRAAVLDHQPDVVVNGAAWTAVDLAERHASDAMAVNAGAVRALAAACDEAKATLVHFGTNFVFDGLRPRLHTEKDQPNPQGVYAWSKWMGELLALGEQRTLYTRPVYVLRIGPPEHGSAASSILRALRAGESPTVTADSVVSPSFGADVAKAVVELLDRRPHYGLYHVANAGYCTWRAFAIEAARCLQLEPRYRVVRSADLGTVAPRPPYAMLSSRKLQVAGITLPTWREALRRELAA